MTGADDRDALPEPPPEAPRFVQPNATADGRTPSAWTGYVKPREGWRRRSKHLLSLTWRLTTQDCRLLIFPTVSAVASLAFGALVFGLTFGPGLDFGETGGSHAFVIPMIIASAPATFVTICCGVATASMVGDLLDGREPSAGRALALLRRRLGVIVAWTLVLWTIGAILKLIQDRVPLGARIVAWLLEVGFSIATMFVVPILAAEGQGPRATFDRSTELVRARFGELVVGSMAIGVGTSVAVVPFIVLLVLSIAVGGALGTALIVLAFAYLLAVTAFSTSLDYVFRTVLYRDAVGLPTERSGFSREDLDLALSRG